MEVSSAGRLNFCQTENDSYKAVQAHLTTDGVFFANSGVYTNGYVKGKTVEQTSDRRAKDVLGDVELRLEAIAASPLVRFAWKDDADRRVNIGSIAQYWLDVLPEVVHTDKHGMYSLEYGVLGTAIGKVNSEAILRHEDELVHLRRRVIKLEAEISRLRG